MFYLLQLLAPRYGVNILRLCLVTAIVLQQRRRKNTDLYILVVPTMYYAKEYERGKETALNEYTLGAASCWIVLPWRLGQILL